MSAVTGRLGASVGVNGFNGGGNRPSSDREMAQAQGSLYPTITSVRERFFFNDGNYQTREGQKIGDVIRSNFPGLPSFSALIVGLVKSYLNRPRGSFCYRYDTNDFGVQIDRLRLSSLGGFADEMMAIANRLGIHLDVTNKDYFPRDGLVRLEWLYPTKKRNLFISEGSDGILVAMNKVSVSAQFLRKMASSYNKHPALQGGAGSMYKRYFPIAVQDYTSMYAEGPIMAPLYVEGGNLLVITHPRFPGRKLCLVGEESFMTALLHRRKEKMIFPGDPTFKNRVAQIGATLTAAEVDKTAKEMYSLGLLRSTKVELNPISHEGTVTINHNIDPALLVPMKEAELQKHKEKFLADHLRAAQILFANHRTIDSFEIPDNERDKVKGIVANYLVQKTAMRILFASMFMTDGIGVHPPESDTLVIPQLGYHLDMFLRPGPGPERYMMLQSYSLCRDLLYQIRDNAEHLRLTTKDDELLDGYIQTAEQLAKDLQPLEDQVREVLTGAGISILPMPALFYGTEKQININFMNGISGWSPVTKRYYYLVIGVTVGDFLGDTLMSMFTKFMQVEVGGIDVIYVGKRPNSAFPRRADFSAAAQWSSICGAGLHCLSMETQVSSVVPAIWKNLFLKSKNNATRCESLGFKTD
jgi:hypothetical protein